MAGDNVAINAGLALIKLIQAILELYMKTIDVKLANLKNERDALKNERDELKGKLDAKDGDKEKIQKELDKAQLKLDNYEKNIDDLEIARKNIDKIINEPGNVTIINAINEVAGDKKNLTDADFTKISEKLANQAFDGLNIDEKNKNELSAVMYRAIVRANSIDVPDDVYKALSDKDSKNPFSIDNINIYINDSNNPREIVEKVKVIKEGALRGQPLQHNGTLVPTDINPITFGKPMEPIDANKGITFKGNDDR